MKIIDNINNIPAIVLALSLIVSLTTQAIKKTFEKNSKFKAFPDNILTAIVSLIISVGFIILFLAKFSIREPISSIIADSIIIAFFTWLCSMLGYDKVMQTIGQFTKGVNKHV